MKKQVVIKIDTETGGISAETFGYVGSSCVDEVSRLLKDLVQLTGSEHKPERWQSEVSTGTDVKVEQER